MLRVRVRARAVQPRTGLDSRPSSGRCGRYVRKSTRSSRATAVVRLTERESIARPRAHIRLVDEETIEPALQIQRDLRRRISERDRVRARAHRAGQKMVFRAEGPGMHQEICRMRFLDQRGGRTERLSRIARNDEYLLDADRVRIACDFPEPGRCDEVAVAAR